MTDQPHNKVDLVTQQLDEAISLFLEGQFVAALRRAGSAEEVLSKALSDSGKQNFLDWKYEEVEPFLAALHRKPLSKEDYIEQENGELVAVTNIASSCDTSVTLDLEHAAYSMIVRACENSDRLGLPRTAKVREFENYYYENVVGLESYD